MPNLQIVIETHQFSLPRLAVYDNAPGGKMLRDLKEGTLTQLREVYQEEYAGLPFVRTSCAAFCCAACYEAKRGGTI